MPCYLWRLCTVSWTKLVILNCFPESPLLCCSGLGATRRKIRTEWRATIFTLWSLLWTRPHGCRHRPLLIQQHPDPRLVQLPPDCLSSGEGYRLLLGSPAPWKLEVVRNKHHPGFLLGSSTSLLFPTSHSALTADLQPGSLKSSPTYMQRQQPCRDFLTRNCGRAHWYKNSLVLNIIFRGIEI